MKVAAVRSGGSFFLPLAFWSLGTPAVAEPSVVFNDQGVLANIERETGDSRNVVGILKKLVSQRGKALQVAQLGAEVLVVVNFAAKMHGGRSWSAYAMIPS